MDTDQSPTQDQGDWVEIPGFSRYQFNPQTKEVRSKPSEHKYGFSIKKNPGQILKPSPTRNGSIRYQLRSDKKIARDQVYVPLPKLMELTDSTKVETII